MPGTVTISSHLSWASCLTMGGIRARSSTAAVAGSTSASRAAWNGDRARAKASKRPQALGLVALDPLARPVQALDVVLHRGPHRAEMRRAEALVRCPRIVESHEDSVLSRSTGRPAYRRCISECEEQTWKSSPPAGVVLRRARACPPLWPR